MSLFDLVTQLREQSNRSTAASKLASVLRVDTALLFVRDPALAVLIPAPGMAQTIRGGNSWRRFLAQCSDNGRHAGEVELPPGRICPAIALLCEDSALVLVGGSPSDRHLRQLEQFMPLLSSLLAAEQQSVLAHDALAAAHDAVRSAETLAHALESARADAAALNAELREAHRRKDEFLAMLGHELRNPLAPLVSAVQLLKLQGGDRPPPPALIAIMARQTAQLSRLVEDLLDVSRVSRGKIELRREPVDLAAVVAAALEESSPVIGAHRHRVVLHPHDGSLVVNGDRARLVQVFGNLLNNAAKYTDPGGTITIALGNDEEHAMVSVADNGVGIAREMQSSIFEIFARVPSGSHRSPDGLGLGLALVRTLVELHGGRIEVSSAGPGQGSTFTVMLPRIPAAATPAVPAQVEPMSCHRSLRIIVVDDNRDAADSLAALLRALGHACEVFYSAESALDSDVGTAVDLALLDLGLPGMNGRELARRLRPRLKSAALLAALTGYGAASDKRQSIEAGFDRHLVKPVSQEALHELLRDAAQRAEPVRD